MQRRDFLGATCLAGTAALGAMAETAAAGDGPKKEYYELRLYRVDGGAMRQGLEGFLGKTAIPALNRIGIEPVGVFSMLDTESAEVYVLLPHKSIESFAAAPRRLLADAEYQEAGASFLNAPKDAPGYQRIESSLMLAFDGAPKLEVPTRKESRIFQLRVYESHSDAKAGKKIEMFNTGGELAIFRRTGMDPVFFGETLIGMKRPNLTYMLGFDDMDAKKAAWAKFQNDPEWKKLRADPAYKDTVSGITNTLLRPAPCSQI